jgi:ribose transport system ATP-binding protein
MFDPNVPLLDVQHLRKAFGAAIALRDASLSVMPGEIHALLGENGAGKSTLIKCLAGTHSFDAGSIRIEGRLLPAHHGPDEAAEAGLAFIHQEGALIEDLSVEENIAIVEGYPRRFGLIDWQAVRLKARQALDALGVSIDPRIKIAALPIADRTTVAIARALALSAKILVLDEPTASLGAKDVAALFAALRRISARGHAIVFVSHRLEEIYALCDRVTVLRDGANAGTAKVSDLTQSELVSMICGHDVRFAQKTTFVIGKKVLAAKSIEGEAIAPFDFSVSAGEIVGFTGLSDAGHYELGKMLFGSSPILSGIIELEGQSFAPHSPMEAMRKGVGYVPADRNLEGLARDMTLRENLFFNSAHGTIAMGGSESIGPRQERTKTEALLKRFIVRPNETEAFVTALSGGNAQKVLLARWLSGRARVLVINDVSVGVDIGAREEIYMAIRQSAEAGAAILIMTSDFEEIMNLCSRAYVLVRGELRAELKGDEITITKISNILAGNWSGEKSVLAMPISVRG